MNGEASPSVRVPHTLELGFRDLEVAPLVTRAVQARFAETSVAVLLVGRAVTENAASVVYLDLANGPAVSTDFEVPDRMAPVGELIASGLVPATAIETIRHGGKLPSHDILFCRRWCVTLSDGSGGARPAVLPVSRSAGSHRRVMIGVR
jgi:hypothetical protein